MPHSGAEIIHDRLVFAASNYKPLKQLRDAWASEASTWLQQYRSLKRDYEREMEANLVAEARGGRDRGTDAEPPPAKRMCVRSGQVAKEKYPGSLTVNPGDKCTFIESCTNPMWSRVKMDSDGRVGVVSASKLVDAPEETPDVLPDPSDDELPDPSDEEEERERRDEEEERERRDEAFAERVRADEAAVVEADAAECGYTD